jgi:methionine-rich copper-binding protein CopC
MKTIWTTPFAALLVSAPAFAHAFLKEAVPPVGGSVATAPAEVMIVFTEGVEPGFSKIEVQDSTGAGVDAGAAHRVGDDETKLAVPLKKLGVGTYTVIWHATATDTHKTQGKFTFTVTP